VAQLGMGGLVGDGDGSVGEWMGWLSLGRGGSAGAGGSVEGLAQLGTGGSVGDRWLS
jgi:hypothetical protein